MKALIFALVFAAHAHSDEIYHSSQLNEDLVVSGSSAEIHGTCGNSGFADWHVDGAKMTATTCGGPICSSPSSFQATATFSGANIILQEGSHRIVFTPATERTVFQICL